MIEFAGSFSHIWNGLNLVLLPDRAIWMPSRNTLIVSDVHLGKGAAFRSAGLPVPAGNSAKDLARLTTLLTQYRAGRLVILGDFMHAKGSHQQQVIQSIVDWRELNQHVEVILVRGNHDRAAGKVPLDWNLQEVEEPLESDGLLFAHRPGHYALPTFCGHVHPVVSLQDFDGSSLRAPCFVFDQTCAILPSFGSFTGGHPMSRQPNRHIFLVTVKRVVPLGTNPQPQTRR